MEHNEIDLKLLITHVARRWYRVVIIVLIGMNGALIINALTYQKVYEAEALVILQQIDYTVGPNSFVDTDFNRSELSIEALERLATSDRVMQPLLDELATRYSDYHVMPPSELRSSLNVLLVAGADNLLGLSARHPKAAQSADLANTWARVLVEQSNQLFTGNEDARLQSQIVQRERVGQELLALQSQLNEIDPSLPEAVRLQSEVNAKRSIYESLEVSIDFISTGLSQRFEVRVASESTIPSQPVSRHLVLWLVLAAVSSIVVGITIVTFSALWSEAGFESVTNDDISH